MKLRKTLCALLACLLLAGLTPSARAAGMTASITKGAVTLNNWAIDNSAAEYPLLLYKDITYFPMTYHLCRLLGLVTDWDNDARILRIDKSGEIADYVPDTGGSHKSQSVSVTPIEYKVIVNGTEVDNSKEKWPLFNYNGVTYFPLTWAFAVEEFGWEYAWDAENGLRIDSASLMTDQADSDRIRSASRAFAGVVWSCGPYELNLTLEDDWTLEGLRQVIRDAVAAEQKGGSLDGRLTEITIPYSFQLPADLKAGTVLTVPYTASYRDDEIVLPSGKTFTPEGVTEERTASVKLTGEGVTAPADSAFQAGQEMYQRLEACLKVPEFVIEQGEHVDVMEALRGAVNANLAAAGLADHYLIAMTSAGAFTEPYALASGESETIDVQLEFAARTDSVPATGMRFSSQITFRVK